MTIAVTNIGTGNGSAVASFTITTPAIAAGATIFVSVMDFGVPNSVTDTAGNTYNKILVTGSPARIALFYAFNSKALSNGNTITVTKGDGFNGCLANAFYATGLDRNSDPHDAASDGTATAAGGATPSVASGMPGRAGELFVALIGWSTSGTPGLVNDAGNGWSNTPPTDVQAFSIELNGGVQVNSGTAAKTFQPTLSGNSGDYMGVTGFKPESPPYIAAFDPSASLIAEMNRPVAVPY